MNLSEYTSEELLPLSGIQHFLYCRRQWALIHIEGQWRENRFTAEGRLMHDRVDDPFFSETRGDVITSRAVPVSSYQLGLIGVCDVVEFIRSAQGVELPGRPGLFQPTPVEYKRGEPKSNQVDEVQLCAQAMCLEEMLSTSIPEGYFYYGKIRHRVLLQFSQSLRSLVQQMSKEMHAYFQRGFTPRVKTSKACKSCSLSDICLPDLLAKQMPASQYIQRQIQAVEHETPV